MNTVKLFTGLAVLSGVLLTMAETNAVSSAEAAAVKTKEDKIFELLNSGNDPFRFEQSSDGNTLSGINAAQMDIRKISASIIVKGILALTKGEAAALVQVGDTSVQLIRKDDLLLMPLSRSAQKAGKNGAAVNKMKYLLVKDISTDSIIVAPEQRPQELIKIR